MTKYHKRPDGSTGVCTAKQKCRFEIISREEYQKLNPFSVSSTSLAVDTMTNAVVKGTRDSLSEASLKVSMMGDNLKPMIFRGMPEKDIENVLSRLKKKISEVTGKTKPVLTVHANNRVGSDIEVAEPKMSVELKFGSQTNVNGGMNALKALLPEKAFNCLPTREVQKTWEAFAEKGEWDKQQKAMFQAQENAKNNIHLPYTPSPTGQFYLNSYAGGITSSSEIMELLKSKNPRRKIVKLVLNPETLQWEEEEWVKLSSDDGWTLNRVLLTENNRLSFYYEHVDGLTFRAVLNQKNTYRWTDSNGVEHETKNKNGYGMGRLSFNGWLS